LARKRRVVDAGWRGMPAGSAIAGRGDGARGRELAAILGATLAARVIAHAGAARRLHLHRCAAPLARLRPARSTMRSWRMCRRRRASGAGRRAGLKPLFDLGMRLGEGSAAALAVPLLRAALACHTGMATFAEAAVDNRD